MSELVNPDTGALEDFEPRRGDETYAKIAALSDRGRRRWGNRVFLSTDSTNFPRARSAATFVATGDLSRDYPIDVQMRWAAANASGQPILPFTYVSPLLVNASVGVEVRRAADPFSTPTTDNYTFGVATTDVLPFDIVTTRNLGIDVRLTSNPGTVFSIWIEVIATIVTDIGQRNKIIGWPEVNTGTPASGFVAAVASPANVLLLAPKASRAQFLVVNTSTNADMIIRFGPGASWVGPTGSVVLPVVVPFASYESPIGGYRGQVTASWNNPAPNGGALITDGTYFFPGQ